MSEDYTETCKTCGNEYDVEEQIKNGDGGMYWVPSCPRCGADIGPQPDPKDIGVMLEVASMSPHDSEYLVGRAMLAAKHIHAEEL